MGSEVCRAVEAADGMRLVGRYDVSDDLGDLSGADVVVEFSVPDATLDNGLHASARASVVGTTGWHEKKLEQVCAALADRPGVGVLIAPNFAIGAILMMAFAAKGVLARLEKRQPDFQGR